MGVLSRWHRQRLVGFGLLQLRNPGISILSLRKKVPTFRPGHGGHAPLSFQFLREPLVSPVELFIARIELRGFVILRERRLLFTLRLEGEAQVVV
jgi:hypothetical protein